MKNLLSLIFLSMLLLVACEKAAPDSMETPDETEPKGGGVPVTFNVVKFEQMAFDDPSSVSRAGVADVCTRINFAVYDMDNNRIQKVDQQVGDSDFGKISLRLPEGTYRIMALAHSGVKNATTTQPEKITFEKNKLTDTFCYCEEVTISEARSYDLQLRRVVSKFRLVVNDKIPASVSKLQFYYTGGSSTFDALAGYGCVNSKQTEVLPVISTEAGQQFEVYTFLHADSGTLRITVTAQDAEGGTVREANFVDVPVTRNTVTQYAGNFFEGVGNASHAADFELRLNDAWEATLPFSF